MPTTCVAINGFGRMGRLALRAAWNREDLQFVHVNELHGDAATAAHLLCFDSVHGRWDHEVSGDGDVLSVDGQQITYSAAAAPGEVPWSEHGAQIVLECSGRFRTIASLAPYFEQGVCKVIVAAPVKDDRALNVVVGVNDARYDPAVHDVVTAASCTTNCLAPIVKVIHEGICIQRGCVTTLHDMTNTQTIVDAPHTDAVFEVKRPTSIAEVNALLKAAADGPLAGILGYEDRPLVSIDYKDDPRSGIVDALSTMVTDHTQVKVLAWYDNEWGYANRLVELAATVAGRLAR